jgi:hypothetical protein
MKIKNTKIVRAPMVAMAVVVALIVGIPSPVSADSFRLDLDLARAELRPINDSGISAKVSFRAKGSELRIRGTAKGLDPSAVDGDYISLLYDILSVATGAFACEPGFPFDVFAGATEAFPGRLTLLEMGLDVLVEGPLLIWVTDYDHDSGAKRTVDGTVNVNLDRIRVISIRDNRINDGIGPEAVVACGLIVPKIKPHSH